MKDGMERISIAVQGALKAEGLFPYDDVRIVWEWDRDMGYEFIITVRAR